MTRLKTLSFIAFAGLIFASVSEAKTDVRALVSRPRETTKSKERVCKTTSDCVLIQCRSHCDFDGAANKKFANAIGERCLAEKRANGTDQITVDCTKSDVSQNVECRKKRCLLIESFRNVKPGSVIDKAGLKETPANPESDDEGD